MSLLHPGDDQHVYLLCKETLGYMFSAVSTVQSGSISIQFSSHHLNQQTKILPVIYHQLKKTGNNFRENLPQY